MTALAAENIVLRRGERTILDRVSLALSPGEFLSVAGPNGSGKSSLLRAMAGVWRVTEGSVTVQNRAVRDFNRRELAQLLSFVPQDTRMDFAFTVEEIVAMGRYARRGRFQSANRRDREATETALFQCDVAHLRHRFVTTLSGGERQRVAIARSLAGEPEIILLDEPTSNLDIEHGVEILDLCRALARDGKSVVLATHDLNMVARYTSHIALLDGGKIAYAGERDGALSSHMLERVFHVDAEILQSAAGHPVFVFHRRR